MGYYRKTFEKIAMIERAMKDGCDSIPLIMAHSGLNYLQIWRGLNKGGFEFPGKKERTLKRIKQGLRERVGSMRELTRRAEITPFNLGLYILENRIKIPEYVEPNRENKIVCEMVEDGESLTKMGEIFDLSRQSMRIYLIGAGLYREWYENAEHWGNKTRGFRQ